jgi:rhamnose utilization protein RhaD (predicted bifunctional aldolase and dehydrogenase)
MADSPLKQLLALSLQLGREERKLAILGEGNTSARISKDTFIVKASGSSLGTLQAGQVAKCRFDGLLPALDARKMTDAEVDEALLASRVSTKSKKPSVEAMFHAWLLTLPGVNFVGHTHPIAVNSIVATKHTQAFATKRICPDEIVCCGAEFVVVPYVDPGLKLAQAIRKAVTSYVKRVARAPRVILLENHGMIALGASPAAVLAATLMAVKAAEVYIGAVNLGSARFMTPAAMKRIEGRPDEHYRRKMLGL